MPRCPWAEASDLDRAYHDEEWGVPIRGDDHLAFEMLTLEGAQSGLSWTTVLAKREGYRRCFAGFDPAKVAPVIREFYEYTTRFKLELDVQWNPMFRPFAVLYDRWVARKMGQFDLPLDDVEQLVRGLRAVVEMLG